MKEKLKFIFIFAFLCSGLTFWFTSCETINGPRDCVLPATDSISYVRNIDSIFYNWTPVNGANGYRIRIYDSTAQVVIVDNEFAPTNSFVLKGANANHFIFIEVRAVCKATNLPSLNAGQLLSPPVTRIAVDTVVMRSPRDSVIFPRMGNCDCTPEPIFLLPPNTNGNGNIEILIPTSSNRQIYKFRVNINSTYYFDFKMSFDFSSSGSPANFLIESCDYIHQNTPSINIVTDPAAIPSFRPAISGDVIEVSLAPSLIKIFSIGPNQSSSSSQYDNQSLTDKKLLITRSGNETLLVTYTRCLYQYGLPK